MDTAKHYPIMDEPPPSNAIIASDLLMAKDDRKSEKGMRVSLMNAGSDIEGKGKSKKQNRTFNKSVKPPA